MNRQKQIALVLLSVLLSMAFMPMVQASTTDSSSGTVGVANSAPVISAMSFENVASANKDGAMIDTFVEHHVEFTVADANTLDDLDTVTVVIWSTEESTVGAGDDEDHFTYIWTESTSAWTEPSGSTMNSGSNADPTDHTSGSGNYVLSFTPGKTADMSDAVTDWNIKVTADDGTVTDTDSTMNFGLNFYGEISATDGTHSWSSLTPGSNNNALSGDGDIDITVTANAAFDIQVKASGNPTSGGNSITVSNIEVHEVTESSAIDLTTSYADVVGLTSEARGSAVTKPFKMWISVPTPQPTGSYTYTLWVQVISS